MCDSNLFFTISMVYMEVLMIPPNFTVVKLVKAVEKNGLT